MQDTNLNITGPEMQVMTDTRFFETKARIIQKLSEHLTQLLHALEAQKPLYQTRLPQGVFNQQGKISRGENYKGLPYLVMDYPRNFENGHVFAYRSMFWWGNFFSYTFHISGRYLEAVEHNLIETLVLIQRENPFLCINAEPWEHHFGEKNFQPASSISTQEWETLWKRGFLKVAFKYPLNEWDRVIENGLKAFDFFMDCFYPEKTG